MPASLTTETYLDAQKAIEARNRGLTFAGPDAALAWWVEAKERMQTAKSPMPETYRTHTDGARSDERVVVQVDGGRGGRIDEVFVTIVTIGKAVQLAERESPRGMAAWHRITTSRATQTTIATEQRVSQQSLSVEARALLARLLALPEPSPRPGLPLKALSALVLARSMVEARLRALGAGGQAWPGELAARRGQVEEPRDQAAIHGAAL